MKKLLVIALALLLAAPTLVLAREGHGDGMNAADFDDSARSFGDDDLDLFDDSNPAAARDRANDRDNVRNVLKFDSMTPISGNLVGTDAIRGVPGGGLPWAVESARGRLDENGKLKLKVTGLVLADSGTNPAPTFRGLVSCIGDDGTEAAPVATADFPTDVDGNVIIEETLSFSGPCLAPIVFVAGPEGQWFAVTGKMFNAGGAVPGNAVPQAGPVTTPVDPANGATAGDADITQTIEPGDDSVSAAPEAEFEAIG